MAKEAEFTVKVETELRDAFAAEAEAAHQPASNLVREFMREFVQRRRETREHDAWFRAEVQRALDDPRPGTPHDMVMDETRHHRQDCGPLPATIGNLGAPYGYAIRRKGIPYVNLIPYEQSIHRTTRLNRVRFSNA